MARSKPTLSSTTLHVKNMVCNRCVRVVRAELEKLGLTVLDIKLGEVILANDPLPMKEIKHTLEDNGFELIADRKARIIEQIKQAVIEFVQRDRSSGSKIGKVSDFIARELNLDYPYLSSLFSSVENITIEQYFILQRIERVKELIKYDELTLSEIAYRMGYSSVAHLSNQFKSVTGMTATQFKLKTENLRKPLDHILS